MANDKTALNWWNGLTIIEQERLQEKHFARQLSDKTIKRIFKFETNKR